MDQGVAFFDLDGTITTKDTFIDFIKFCRGNAYYYFGLILLGPFILLFFLKLYPNYKLKETFFRFYLSKFTVHQLTQLGTNYADNRLPILVRPLALERIQWHKQQKHRVIILTASSPIWLASWCEYHQLELIGTMFESQNNYYTGKILGKNCYGEQKKMIVQKMLDEFKTSSTYGYGDTAPDLLFMELLNEKYYKPFV